MELPSLDSTLCSSPSSRAIPPFLPHEAGKALDVFKVSKCSDWRGKVQLILLFLGHHASAVGWPPATCLWPLCASQFPS